MAEILTCACVKSAHATPCHGHVRIDSDGTLWFTPPPGGGEHMIYLDGNGLVKLALQLRAAVLGLCRLGGS